MSTEPEATKRVRDGEESWKIQKWNSYWYFRNLRVVCLVGFELSFLMFVFDEFYLRTGARVHVKKG